MLTYTPEQIASLVDEAKTGHRLSLERLVNIFHADILRMVFYRTRSRLDAEDLTQEIFLKVMKSIRKLKDGKRFKSWLYRIAINHLRDHFRKKKILSMIGIQSGTEDLLELEPGPENPVEQYEKKEFQRYLFKYINELSNNEKEVFNLRFLEQLKIREMSFVLNKSESTIKTYLYRALKKLGKNEELHAFLTGDVS